MSAGRGSRDGGGGSGGARLPDRVGAGVVDTHAHLDDPRLAERLDEVLGDAASVGLVRVVAISTTLASSWATLGIAEGRSGVFAAVGIHPTYVDEAAPGDFEAVAELARAHPRVVAIGETGLDDYWKTVPIPRQREMFERHLDLAEALDLPAVIHCRQSETLILDQLRSRGRPVKGILHSFTGNVDDARAFLDAGLHVSFAGQITFANKSLEALRAAAAFVPDDRILVETDSPYLAPEPNRGRSNHPANVGWTLRRLAEIRGISVEDCARLTTGNAASLFRWPAPDTLGAAASGVG